MQQQKLKKVFFQQTALNLAPQLLHKYLCRKIGNDIIKVRITETEAYCGEIDTACHARKGKTNRTAIMYEQGGFSYIYLCYGIHYLLNVVAGKRGSPEAVLIRGVEGYNGPGKLTKALHIDKHLNAIDLTLSDELWLENDASTSTPTYITTPRIGIDYASEEYRLKLWRFLLPPKKK